MTKWAWMISTVVPLLAACETVESKNVRTDGIYADFRATADGSGRTRVSASLRVGGSGSNTYLDLSEGDVLSVEQGGTRRTMERHSDVFGAINYSAEIPTDAADTFVRVAFTRAPHDMEEAACRGESAPYSIVAMPAPFAFTGPSDNQRYSRADDDVVISWSPSGGRDAISWSLSGNCIRPESGELSSDTGRLELGKGRLVAFTERQESEICSVEVRVTRTRIGEVDPAYGEGGRFVAEQVRRVSFESAP